MQFLGSMLGSMSATQNRRAGSRASSPSPPRSPSPTATAARCATAASTSRSSSGRVPFEQVWGLLVDGDPARARARRRGRTCRVRSGDARADLQAALAHARARLGLAPLIDIDARRTREDLARASAPALSFVAQSARGADLAPVPPRDVDEGRTLAERFLLALARRGRPRPTRRPSTPTGSPPPSTA